MRALPLVYPSRVALSNGVSSPLQPEEIPLEKNGFKAYYVVYGADAVVTTVTVCEDHPAAEVPPRGTRMAHNERTAEHDTILPGYWYD